MISKDKYSLEEIKTGLNNILINTPVKKAVLFGSYADGRATDESDIDILIDSEGALVGLNFFEVYEDISSTFSKPVDLIEAYDLAEDSDLFREIQQKGLIIYEQKE